MRNLFIVEGLLLLVSSCGPSVTPGAPPKVSVTPKRVAVPAAVTEKTYRPLLDLFIALPLSTEGRTGFRNRLMEYLVSRANSELKNGLQAKAFKSFEEALRLYDPVEVFSNRARDDRLAKLAQQLDRLYSPRGDETAVLMTICVQMTLLPERRSALEARFHRVTRWLMETGRLVHGQSRSWHRIIDALESTEKVWPSSFVLEQLRKGYIEQKMVVARAVHVSPYRHLRGAVSALFRTGFKIARIYLHVDRPQQALKHLKEVSTEPNQDEELIQLLSRATAASATASDHLRLAGYFEERDRRIALRICRASRERFHDRAETYGCTGRLAAALDLNYTAMVNLERATQLAPGKRSYAELLARSYQQRLKSMIWDEKIGQAQKELSRIATFYREAEKRFNRPLTPPLSKVHIAMGHGLYNAGRVDEAAAAFQRSISADPTSSAYVQLATIYHKRNEPVRALKYLKLAEEVPMSSAGLRIYWQARIEGLRAQSLRLSGKTEQSLSVHHRAIRAWRQFQTIDLVPEHRAEAFVHEARSLYAVGQRAAALSALDRAIDTQPDRKETYADVIAMLTTYGHFPEALDAYHRALGRKEISEYLKSYCSFWVIGLARRAGLEPDPLAMSHLGSVHSDTWYRQLALFHLGKVSYEELLRKAKTRGDRAELYFYQADRLLARGRLAQARKLWKKVLETNMMAFYEFDMAAHNLRLGPTQVSTRPLDRKQATVDKGKETRD
jgi:tetratricopeptide (TPR) repeat protein